MDTHLKTQGHIFDIIYSHLRTTIIYVSEKIHHLEFFAFWKVCAAHAFVNQPFVMSTRAKTLTETSGN